MTVDQVVKKESVTPDRHPSMELIASSVNPPIRRVYERGDLFTWGTANLTWDKVALSLSSGKFPSEIRGEFAFVWQSPSQLFAAVDHLCSTPLFYTQNHIGNVFHDVSRTLSHPRHSLKVKFQIEFLGGHSLGENTTIEQVKRLMPGYFLSGNVAHPYIDFLNYQGDEPADHSHIRELIESEILASTRTRNTLLLSGGTDSVALAGTICSLGLKDRFAFLHAYSSAQALSDKPVVQDIASQMGLNIIWQEVPFSGDIIPEDSARQYSFWIENPFPGKKRAVQLAHLESTRIFTGEIGDQLFGGPKLPALLSHLAQSQSPSAEQLAKIWINQSFSYGRDSGWQTHAKIARLMNENSEARDAYNELVHSLTRLIENQSSPNLAQRLMMLNYVTKGPYRMWAYSQDALDWMHPFASWKVFDYAYRTRPLDRLGYGGTQKRILLDLWRDNLSDLPWRLPKYGFGIPAISKLRRDC